MPKVNELNKQALFAKRSRPTQKRAQETFDLILDTTALLLEEVGFDKLNTNLICQRANITPPALYRYFPNKYAILKELGEKLMDAQNEAIMRWLANHDGEEVGVQQLAAVLRDQYDVTANHNGAKWIMRSLRSIPMLADVRFESHEYIVNQLAAWQLRHTPDLPEETLKRRLRIINEAGYALLEMLIDNDGNDLDATLMEASTMFLAMLRYQHSAQ